MRYNEQNYQDRMRVRGTPAERAFVRYALANGWRGARYGFEAGVEGFWKLPEVIRSTPDFVLTDPNPMLVEVKGCGRDGLIKLKDRDMKALAFWDTVCHLSFFFYDSDRHRVAFVSFLQIADLLRDETIMYGVYPDNNARYAKLPVDRLGWVPAS